jgi:hypothetical protein
MFTLPHFVVSHYLFEMSGISKIYCTVVDKLNFFYTQRRKMHFYHRLPDDQSDNYSWHGVYEFMY